MLELNVYSFSLQFATQTMDMRRESFQPKMLQDSYAKQSKEMSTYITMLAINNRKPKTLTL